MVQRYCGVERENGNFVRVRAYMIRIAHGLFSEAHGLHAGCGAEASGVSLRRWLGPRLKPRTAFGRRGGGRLKPPRTPMGLRQGFALGCQATPDCFQPAEARASGGPERFHRSLNPRPQADAWRLGGPVAGSACALGLGPGLTPRREAGASLSIEPERRSRRGISLGSCVQ